MQIDPRALLIPYIPTNDLRRHLVSYGADKISISPKFSTPQLPSQPWKSCKYLSGRDALHDLHDPGWRVSRRCKEKYMHMVFHYFHSIDFHTIRFRHTLSYFSHCLSYLADQKFLSVFRRPYKVIFQVIDCMRTRFWCHLRILSALRAARFHPHSKLWGIQLILS